MSIYHMPDTMKMTVITHTVQCFGPFPQHAQILDVYEVYNKESGTTITFVNGKAYPRANCEAINMLIDSASSEYYTCYDNPIYRVFYRQLVIPS